MPPGLGELRLCSTAYPGFLCPRWISGESVGEGSCSLCSLDIGTFLDFFAVVSGCVRGDPRYMPYIGDTVAIDLSSFTSFLLGTGSYILYAARAFLRSPSYVASIYNEISECSGDDDEHVSALAPLERIVHTMKSKPKSPGVKRNLPAFYSLLSDLYRSRRPAEFSSVADNRNGASRGVGMLISQVTSITIIC